jgi:RNA polymerase sigma factor (sigma-70 family)
MATGPLSDVIQHLRRAAAPRDGADMSDGQLLERFVAQRDDDALAILVRRHGPMVWGVCRRVLRSREDAEDAFQAAFLVLVRRASSVVPREMIGNWLHGVALQTALKARATAARRRMHERRAAERPRPAAREQDSWPEVKLRLDEELSRLPMKYRAAILLCDLEGKPRKEAARLLGVPEGTLSGHLTRGRALLARRLARYGLAISSGTLTVLLVQSSASASVPATLVSSSIRLARLLAAGEAAGAISAGVSALTEGASKSMLLAKMKLVGVLMLATVVVAAAATGRVLCQTQAAPVSNAPGRTAQAADAQAQDKAANRNDAGAPLQGPVEPKEMATLKGHNRPVYSVAFAPDGKTLASSAGDGTIRLWDAATAKPRTTLKGHTSTVQTIAFAPDGKTLASGSNDGTIRVWDLAAPKELTAFARPQAGYFSVAFSPDGKTLASGAGDSTTGREVLSVWDVATGKEQVIFNGKSNQVHSVAFSPDGKVLASGSEDGTVRFWDPTAGNLLAAVQAHTGAARGLAFSPDGKLLASASKDGTVKLWDAAAYKERATLKTDCRTYAVAFTADGKTLASGCDDATIRVWDMATMKERAKLEGHTGEVLGVAISPDGKTLASSSADGTVKLWDMAPGR